MEVALVNRGRKKNADHVLREVTVRESCSESKTIVVGLRGLLVLVHVLEKGHGCVYDTGNESLG
jgi:hypothetical protein